MQQFVVPDKTFAGRPGNPTRPVLADRLGIWISLEMNSVNTSAGPVENGYNDTDMECLSTTLKYQAGDLLKYELQVILQAPGLT